MNADIGRYRITRTAGTGGTGEVYQAVDTVLGRTVAIKMLDAGLDPEVLRREARALARLDHPNIVALHDLVEEHGRAYLVMEYVEGVTLAERLSAHGPLQTEQGVHLVRQVASAVSWAHGSGIIHCDIKPANILLASSGAVKLADFTLARPTHRDGTESTEGATSAFAAPEQTEGGDVGEQADIYALGRLIEVSLAAANPRSSRDRAVRSVIARATAANPDQRYATVREMLDSLPAPTSGVTQLAGQIPNGEHTRLAPIERVAAADPSIARVRSRSAFVLLPGAAAAILVGAGLVNHFNAAASPELVTLPNLVRTQQASAEQVTASLQLRRHEVRRFSATVPAGAIIAQSPGAGSHLRANSVVNLVISRGPRPVQVPDMSGLNQDVARVALAKLGLRVRITTSTTVFHHSGEVLGQDPAAGVTRTPGATVTLTVSQAPCWIGIIAC